MFRQFLRAKINNATITGLELDYEGSVTIPRQIMNAVGFAAGERVQVLNRNNGNRLETYVIKGHLIVAPPLNITI